ncbi:MAG: extracellular solute-binding protein, partial [Clostridia bacterium]|nr:extracellular solute-binding protein [Clostridia bacterium]
MKRIFSLILAFVFCFAFLIPLASCDKEEELVLKVYNWEDYIACEDYDMIAEFEAYYEETHGESVTVEYSTFGTNENMYNELKLTQKPNGDYSYDLVCPSEYMIQKMIFEGMLEEFDFDEDNNYLKVPNYTQNVADFIKDLFYREDKGWYKYATCYNWGTMGYTYNPEFVDSELVAHWDVVLNKDKNYANKITIKDSVRDSYILAMGILFQEELSALDKDAPDYNDKINSYLNDFSPETVEKARVLFEDVKANLYGFEVDSGKQDMATGKITINFAWSGDAVYAMDIAEEYDAYLEYVVPEEASNIFFDGWVMPKGANTELAQEFLNFMYREDNAIENLDYICYSSPIVGEDVFTYVCENY